MSRFVVKIDKYDKIIYYDLLMREIKIVNKNSLNTKFESYDSDERIALMNYINNKIKYSNDTLSITDAITYDCDPGQSGMWNWRDELTNKKES